MLKIQFSKQFKGEKAISNQEHNAIFKLIQQHFNGKSDRGFSNNLVINTGENHYQGSFSSNVFTINAINKALIEETSNLEKLISLGEITQNGPWYTYKGEKYNGKKAINKVLSQA